MGYGRLVKNTPKNWEHALVELVDCLDESKEFARKEPYQFGLKQNIYDNVDTIISTYQKIALKALGRPLS